MRFVHDRMPGFMQVRRLTALVFVPSGTQIHMHFIAYLVALEIYVALHTFVYAAWKQFLEGKTP